MKSVWLCTLALPALYALVGCTSSARDEESFETSSSNLTSQALLKSTTFLDTQAAAWVDKDDWGFVQGGRCVMSCHTTAPFMMIRPRLPGATGTSGATLASVRGYVEARVNSWSTVAPLYSWVAPDSRGLEAIMNALALVFADAPTGTLSVTAKKALAAMWNEQKADGSFPWWSTFTLAPWENPEAILWGAALADLVIGMTPPSYVLGMTTQEKAKLVKLEDYLRARVAPPSSSSSSSPSPAPAPLHNRAMVLLAAAKRPTLLTQVVKDSIGDEIRDLQGTNGAWSAQSLGFTVSGGAAAASADHAYATAFYTYALAQSGDTIAAANGRAWLESHQRSDGAWEAKSLNSPTDAWNNQLITDGATAYALMALVP